MQRSDEDLRQRLRGAPAPQPPRGLDKRLLQDHADWSAQRASTPRALAGSVALAFDVRNWLVALLLAGLLVAAWTAYQGKHEHLIGDLQDLDALALISGSAY